jgi:hypothetical protein
LRGSDSDADHVSQEVLYLSGVGKSEVYLRISKSDPPNYLTQETSAQSFSTASVAIDIEAEASILEEIVLMEATVISALPVSTNTSGLADPKPSKAAMLSILML